MNILYCILLLKLFNYEFCFVVSFVFDLFIEKEDMREQERIVVSASLPIT